MTVLTREDFLELDHQDQLAHFRKEFHIPQGVIYMDGNSLGAMPKTSSKRVREVTDREWAHNLIKSWNTADWFNAPRRIGDKIARIMGAEEGEVVATDSTGPDGLGNFLCNPHCPPQFLKLFIQYRATSNQKPVLLSSFQAFRRPLLCNYSQFFTCLFLFFFVYSASNAVEIKRR